MIRIVWDLGLHIDKYMSKENKTVEMTGDVTWYIKKQASSKLRDELRQSHMNADTERHK